MSDGSRIQSGVNPAEKHPQIRGNYVGHGFPGRLDELLFRGLEWFSTGDFRALAGHRGLLLD
jgi:hypothetical protein